MPNLPVDVKEAKHGGDVEHIHHRTEDTENEDLASLCTAESGVFLVELVFFTRLAVEDLNDLHTRKVFREEGVDVGGAVLYFAVSLSRELTEDDRKEHDKGNEAKHHKGKRVVNAKHSHEHAHDDKAVLYQVYEKVGKHH